LGEELLYLGQVADTYLVLLRGKDLLLLDQHAAHERILAQRFSRGAERGEIQMLALPLELRLHPAELECLEGLWSDLAKLGFSISLESSAGAGSSSSKALLLVKGIPPLLNMGEAREFLRSALAEKIRDFSALLTMLACKGAVKAGQRLSRDEALGLIRQWRETPQREFCPHGRPAALILSGSDLEKMFKRK
jgi:DNA mismatch repair protein MutL